MDPQGPKLTIGKTEAGKVVADNVEELAKVKLELGKVQGSARRGYPFQRVGMSLCSRISTLKGRNSDKRYVYRELDAGLCERYY